jgi:hypothetical protein
MGLLGLMFMTTQPTSKPALGGAKKQSVAGENA